MVLAKLNVLRKYMQLQQALFLLLCVSELLYAYVFLKHLLDYLLPTKQLSAGAAALRIISAGFIVSSVSVTASGALEGLGKGIPSLIISIFRYVAVIIPAAFILSRIYGAVGVWHSFWITEIITAVIAYFTYRHASK